MKRTNLLSGRPAEVSALAIIDSGSKFNGKSSMAVV